MGSNLLESLSIRLKTHKMRQLGAIAVFSEINRSGVKCGILTPDPFVFRVHDYGFAPNPFWGYCTLGVCTPNHQGIKLNADDWILGNSSVGAGSLLIYAMRVSEALDFDEYFRDARFKKKKFCDQGWKEKSGDNIYFKNDSGDWEQAETQYHEDEHHQEKDLKHPTVFVGREFYYFGEAAESVPDRFRPLLRIGKGCCCKHPIDLVEEFITWIRETFETGVHGDPRDADVEDLEPKSRSCR